MMITTNQCILVSLSVWYLLFLPSSQIGLAEAFTVKSAFLPLNVRRPKGCVDKSIKWNNPAPSIHPFLSNRSIETTALYLFGQNEKRLATFEIPFVSSFLSSVASPMDRPILAMVDLISLLGFAAVGKASHSGVDGSLDILSVLMVAFPFVLSWFVTSPLTGVYRPEATKYSGDEEETLPLLVKDTFVNTGKGWIVAIPLGCALRGVIKGYTPPVPFVVVTMIATLVLLGVSRVVFALAESAGGKIQSMVGNRR